MPERRHPDHLRCVWLLLRLTVRLDLATLRAGPTEATMSERSLEIADDLARVLSTQDTITDNIGALFDCLTFALAQLCPTCRRSMAASICNQLLAHAEEHAADNEAEPTDCGHPRLN